MAYQIMISETQRALLVAALKARPRLIAAARDALTIHDNDYYNIEGLLPCLECLPEDEAKHPDVLHGICL